jgi:hypothetical protein
MATYLSRNDGHRAEVDRREDEDVGSEHATVSGECETEAGN